MKKKNPQNQLYKHRRNLSNNNINDKIPNVCNQP